jgi:hypothetical protein
MSEATSSVPETVLARWKNQLLAHKTLLLLVVATVWIIPALTAKTDKPGEFYPFSNFPMYASFSDATYYVYLTDLKNQPLHASRLFGLSLSEVKKKYDGLLTQLKKDLKLKMPKAQLPMEYKQQAAQAVLTHIVKHVPAEQRAKLAQLEGVRIHQVDIQLLDGRIQKESQALGEQALNAAVQP